MRELTDRALNLAEVQGASYADIRIVRRRTQNITIKNGVAEVLADNESRGFGVRVVADGAWGFAASAQLNPAEVDRITALAVQIAPAPYSRPATSTWDRRWHTWATTKPRFRGIRGTCRWRKRSICC